MRNSVGPISGPLVGLMTWNYPACRDKEALTSQAPPQLPSALRLQDAIRDDVEIHLCHGRGNQSKPPSLPPIQSTKSMAGMEFYKPQMEVELSLRFGVSWCERIDCC
jgi:hypothetical protein